MKNKFIRFLKDYHAFDEWKRAVGGEAAATKILNGLTANITAECALLEDGWHLFYSDAAAGVPWFELDEAWKEIVSRSGSPDPDNKESGYLDDLGICG